MVEAESEPEAEKLGLGDAVPLPERAPLPLRAPEAAALPPNAPEAGAAGAAGGTCIELLSPQRGHTAGLTAMKVHLVHVQAALAMDSVGAERGEGGVVGTWRKKATFVPLAVPPI